MKNSILRLTITVAMTTIATAAMAQVPPTTPPSDPQPQPRVNEVDQRLENQQNRIDKGVADGKISSTAAAADDAKISKEESRVSKDEAAHDGHLTKGETKRLNERETRGGHHIRHQRGSSTATPETAN